MERTETDDDDRPVTDILIKGGTVFVNPYKDEEEAERKQAEVQRLKVGRMCALRACLSTRHCYSPGSTGLHAVGAVYTVWSDLIAELSTGHP